MRDWGPLPGTAAEVQELARQFGVAHPEAVRPELLEGALASESAVKAAAPGHAILHFATHGFFEREGFVSRWQRALQRAHTTREARGFGALAARSDSWSGSDPFAGANPLEGEEPGLLSGLILAGGNLGIEDGGADDDGVLTATEVAGLDLTSCRLAVLSACQSSLGSGRTGEGLQSLRRGFAEAGCDSVIATLWKVDDDATQQLMRAFYEELWVSGRGVSEAFRHARLRLMDQYRDPYYWGAFTLSGEWR